MLKILFVLTAALAFVFLMILIVGIISSITAGGGNVLFPGLGLIVALPLILAVLLGVEIILVIITVILYKRIRA